MTLEEAILYIQRRTDPGSSVWYLDREPVVLVLEAYLAQREEIELLKRRYRELFTLATGKGTG